MAVRNFLLIYDRVHRGIPAGDLRLAGPATPGRLR
jgi:hypothetical protein